MTIVCLVLGVPLLAWGVWSLLGRTPRARAWATGDRPRTRMFVVPFGGAALVLAALIPPLEGAPAALVAVTLAFLVCLLVVVVFGMLAVPAPGFLEPRWCRGLDRCARTKRVSRRRGASPPRAPVHAVAADASPGPAWTAVRDDVRADIARLRPEESVMLTADAQRFVEIYHYGDRLGIDCAGSQAWGGPALVGPEAEAELVRLGFTTPMERRGELEVHTAYRQYVSTGQATAPVQAANLAVAALAILGVRASDHLDRVVS